MDRDTTAIWTTMHERLLSFIERRVADRADAEDILQDVFARIHANIESLHDTQRTGSWVYQITRNAITDHHRARGRRSRLSMAEAGEVANDEDTHAVAEEELAKCISPLLAALPETYREAVMLTELDGLTQKAAARRAGLSLSGMKSRVQRGRDQLRRKLLECCHVEFDRRGAVIEYEVKDCPACGSDRRDSTA